MHSAYGITDVSWPRICLVCGSFYRHPHTALRARGRAANRFADCQYKLWDAAGQGQDHATGCLHAGKLCVPTSCVIGWRCKGLKAATPVRPSRGGERASEDATDAALQ